jgi:hypothetical protein
MYGVAVTISIETTRDQVGCVAYRYSTVDLYHVPGTI